jgi:3-phosphoshikimate 1-carboxyvinyltransferase
MAQVSKICSGGAQSTQIFHNNPKPHKPKSLNSVNFRSQFLVSSNSWTLKHKNVCVSSRRAGVVRVSASVATPEKPSTVPEIVLQPIKEISGAITLPGSKSLSNRILLLAALSEVYNHCVLVGNSSFLVL